ncbi:hypothetical protein [Paraburkholderia sp. SUR17]|uniref:hypothetical protein n=1 Tax=Paraburkholderia sp. SUR17 TaxID=3034358 RepID=UPI002407F34E|nr:hypothetical protein [Paraburkholderia sp. SUR17]WEY41061.1 hypothetical protein P2869_26640 [Paraburkholderia sp. SUR17]
MNHASVLSHSITRNPSRSATESAADAHLDAHLDAYNAAFSDLGLRFRWDHDTLAALNEFSSELARITAYIERFHAHLHRAYDADFLAQLILSKKSEYFREISPQAGN